jgi:hypothetical protein
VKHGARQHRTLALRPPAVVQQLAEPLNEAKRRELREALADHDRGLTTANPTIGCCWDADRLDLGRVGIEPDPELMSTDAGRKRARALGSGCPAKHGRPSPGSDDRPSHCGALPGSRSRAAAPTDPARLRCATFVCRQEGPAPTGGGADFHRAQRHASGEAGRRTSVPAGRPARSSLRSPKRFPPWRKTCAASLVRVTPGAQQFAVRSACDYEVGEPYDAALAPQ